MPAHRLFQFLRRIFLCASVALVSPGLRAEDLSRDLASTAATPCLDAVIPLEKAELLHKAALSFVEGVGRGRRLAAGWVPGNRHFDEAHSITYTALQASKEVSALLEGVNAKTYLQSKFRRGLSEEQQYLKSFFAAEEGKVFWLYMIDGAHCNGLFDGVAKRNARLTAAQRETVSAWKTRLAAHKQSFITAFARLDTQQRAQFDRTHKLFSRLSKQEAPDERDFQLSLIPEQDIEPTLMKGVAAVGRTVLELADQFSKSEAVNQ